VTWLSPERLWLLAAVAALVVAYVVLQRRRSRYAVRFTNLKLLDRVAPARPQWRRHVPAGLFLAMLALPVVGFARPQSEVQVPRERATVLVAVDVSRSMLATDVEPDRLTAAKAAAHQFVADLPEQFNVGLVGFAGIASVFVPPVTDRAPSTPASTGSPRARRAAPASRSATPSPPRWRRSARWTPRPARTCRPPGWSCSPTVPTPPGRIRPRPRCSPPSWACPSTPSRSAPRTAPSAAAPSAAVAAADSGCRSTGRRCRRSRTPPGNYFEAGSAEELRSAYADIGSSIGYETETQDVSARFIGFGLLFAVPAALASMFWFARLP